MHTTKVNDTVFIHDGDYSGDTEIVTGEKTLHVPTEDLLGFAAEYARSRIIGQVERATLDDLIRGASH